MEDRPGIAVLRVSGRGAAALFNGKVGGHRWQRVPPTEKRGRVQTSTITAKTMLDVSVSSVEVRTEIPEIARADLTTKFNDQFEGDSTPVDEIPIDAIDDAIDVIDKIIVDPEE